MSVKAPEHAIERHEAFLYRLPVERPLLGYWFGGYYPAEQFPRGAAHWSSGSALRPDGVKLARFAEDYEELYRRHAEADDDFFFVASPYWGIPWLEAMLGCPVEAADLSCRTRTCLGSLEDVDRLQFQPEGNAWLEALMRYTRDLLRLAAGRFPVCPPLLRGPGDCAAAMLGAMRFVTGFLDEPARMRRLLEHCSAARREVLRRLHSILPAWNDTHAAGGYPSRLWCRRTVAYHQEDSAALLSPTLFREFLLPLHRNLREVAEVNFLHLHSACLYPLYIFLEDGSYDVLEINIDHAGAGPPLARLLPTFRKIQAAGRPLILWGEFDAEDWDKVHRELSPIGLSLQPMVRGEP